MITFSPKSNPNRVERAELTRRLLEAGLLTDRAIKIVVASPVQFRVRAQKV